MTRKGTVVAVVVLTALVAITAVTHYRSWSLSQLASGGWPPQEPVVLLSWPTPVATLEVSRQLYAYLETPTAYCRRLQLLGGSCSSSGALSGHTLLCRDDAYAPESGQCLVYSASSAGEWSFARDAAHYQCEVHVFDPALPTSTPRPEHAAGVQFHRLGLAGRGRTETGAQALTLSELKEKVGHAGRVIDFLRVDVQGDEWGWLERDIEALSDVRQLGMRVYLSLDSLRRHHSLLWKLQALGLRLVYSAADSATGRAWDVEGVDGKVAVVYDLVFINRRRCRATFGCGA
ncbi:methyltransferase-like protein 24 [Amphibalanus amphitrite]|uniref:methyltransferase-like protein 24 n=1 Tax=Amphibalanus amphitrite TaxID=1232801 RepID=UPI001C901A6F|nr:methyltransferase-like protein 24 [Amphibalanus amphitrite]